MKAFLLLLAFAGAAVAGPISEEYCQKLALAIWRAEGGDKARVPFGILSVRTRSPEHAREICLRTIRNNWDRWEKMGRPGDYLEFLARRYAPLGASNDPQRLNRHWLRNTRRFLSETKSDQILNAGSRYAVESI